MLSSPAPITANEDNEQKTSRFRLKSVREEAPSIPWHYNSGLGCSFCTGSSGTFRTVAVPASDMIDGFRPGKFPDARTPMNTVDLMTNPWITINIGGPCARFLIPPCIDPTGIFCWCEVDFYSCFYLWIALDPGVYWDKKEKVILNYYSTLASLLHAYAAFGKFVVQTTFGLRLVWCWLLPHVLTENGKNGKIELTFIEF